jgi:nucleotide-binding universal stress UspA family protein
MGIKIVVGYDFSETSNIALAEALRQASLQPGSLLHALVVLDDKQSAPFPDIAVDYHGAAAMQERLDTVVQAQVAELRPEGLVFFVHARIGNPAEQLLGLATEAEADLVCVGTHGRSGVKRLLLGSVAEHVVRHARCPVLVARAADYPISSNLELESACPACVERRKQTSGAEWWCEPHAKPYVPPTRYHYEQKIAIMRPDDQPIL